MEILSLISQLSLLAMLAYISLYAVLKTLLIVIHGQNQDLSSNFIVGGVVGIIYYVAYGATLPF